MAAPAAAGAAATNSAAAAAGASGGASAGAQAAIGAGVQGGFGIFSSILASAANKRAQGRAMAYNSLEALKNRQWQEAQATTAWDRQMEASNTAYQRASLDMQAAGLNPMMMYGGGSSPASAPHAATGGGDSASTSPEHYDTSDMVEGIKNAVSSALQSKQVEQQGRLFDAEIKAMAKDDLVKAATATKLKEEAATERVERHRVLNSALNVSADTAQKLKELNMMQMRYEQLAAAHPIKKALGYYSALRDEIERTAETIGAIKSLTGKGSSARTVYHIMSKQ